MPSRPFVRQQRRNKTPRTLCHHVILVALVALISACSSAPPVPQRPAPLPPQAQQASEEERWAKRLNSLASLEDWRVRGKVAYRLPDDAGSASLDWQQADEQSELRLSGPLGVGSTEVHNEGALLRVKRDGIERLYPADAAPWLHGGTLLPVPVGSIQHWLRGVPDPAQPVTLLVTDNALASRIEQNGWVVEYSDYKDVRGLAMPARLLLTVPKIELSLKLILRAWEF
ncbi:lipoprotein insertase outer membrane protein LolB [Congregibacter variabilis]|uniref:Outer-membrane lipoprotein LolB n=1 Tax=Congregibacter variabilis TaxID=3081200 RepID=A0ABZ0I7I6_9GAMM|nr:lipoprotein insertase outer membrane protein LolB [Congregibacter sp. IMCC43200]